MLVIINGYVNSNFNKGRDPGLRNKLHFRKHNTVTNFELIPFELFSSSAELLMLFCLTNKYFGQMTEGLY